MVYQNDHVVAFEDITPQAPTHVLVVPRRHIATLNDLVCGDDALVGEMVRAAPEIAKDARPSRSAGIVLVFNCNADAGQTVFHLHCICSGAERWVAPRVKTKVKS